MSSFTMFLCLETCKTFVYFFKTFKNLKSLHIVSQFNTHRQNLQKTFIMNWLNKTKILYISEFQTLVTQFVDWSVVIRVIINFIRILKHWKSTKVSCIEDKISYFSKLNYTAEKNAWKMKSNSIVERAKP